MIRKLKNIYHRVRALFAQIYFGFPARHFKVIGITGTDGKTTTAFFLYNILLKAGFKVALISTIEARFGDKVVDVGLHVTNPDEWHLPKLLKRIANEGMEYVILEVTSHGIDQGRIWGINFDVAGLTNITPEHLDYHKTFENYKNTKLKFLNSAKKSFKTDEIPDELISGIKVKLPGGYNRLNAKLAAAIAKHLGVSDEKIKEGIESLEFIPGRMQIVYDKGFKVIVDFAHTPNGLEKALTEARKMVSEGGRVISVFGSAGERDFKKRPKMGEIAGWLADLVVITAEDPRSEDVNAISMQIASGVERSGKKREKDYFVINDRKEAIEFAITKLAKKGDVVIITGKGHEKSMNYGKGEIPWSDVSTATSASSKVGS